jgi:homoserine trans-succinylase
MTTYASFDYYEGHPYYLTPGKRYEVSNENNTGFYINNDKGKKIYCRWRDCPHLCDHNWTRHDEPKQTRYHIQVPGYAFIEHVMDYRMDGDVLYAAGADFEHYYRMKPGDLVTITEMED